MLGNTHHMLTSVSCIAIEMHCRRTLCIPHIITAGVLRTQLRKRSHKLAGQALRRPLSTHGYLSPHAALKRPDAQQLCCCQPVQTLMSMAMRCPDGRAGAAAERARSDADVMAGASPGRAGAVRRACQIRRRCHGGRALLAARAPPVQRARSGADVDGGRALLAARALPVKRGIGALCAGMHLLVDGRQDIQVQVGDLRRVKCPMAWSGTGPNPTHMQYG
jgi:hypothetical protein